MVIVKANAESEAGQMPSQELMTAMGEFNQEMQRAGIVRAAEGLKPSSQGARVRLANGEPPRVIDGPFAETKELIAGFWILEVGSREEVIEWMKRCPVPHNAQPGEHFDLEIRPFNEMEDFGETFSAEARATNQRMREEMAKRQG